MQSPVSVSFELFPPADAARFADVLACVERLAAFGPRFFSVTYGADGALRGKSRDLVLRLHRETGLTVAPHLTCVGESRDTLLRLVGEYRQLGLRHLVLLRGDPPRPEPGAPGAPGASAPATPLPIMTRPPAPGCLLHASDLVAAIETTFPDAFEISVAVFPEGHPESAGVEADLDNLRRKVEAGARRAITQFCFDTEAIVRYRDRVAAAGLGAPVRVVPGILPILKFEQLRRFAARCGAVLPGWLCQAFEGLENSPETRRLTALHVALDQIERLKREGFTDFHFYTLNSADLTASICQAAGLRSSSSRSRAAAQTGSSIERASGVKSTGPASLMCQQSSSRTPNSPGI